eukprot:scaffold4547_cov335-Prasinococcus_capsulatus_cf.AAC.6
MPPRLEAGEHAGPDSSGGYDRRFARIHSPRSPVVQRVRWPACRLLVMWGRSPEHDRGITKPAASVVLKCRCAVRWVAPR